MTIIEQRYMEEMPYYTKNIAESLELQNKIAALTLAKNAGLISNDELSKELKPIFNKLNINLN